MLRRHCPQTVNSVKESEKIGAERVAWSLGKGPSRKGAKPQRRKGTEKRRGEKVGMPHAASIQPSFSSSFLSCGFAAWRLCVRVSRADAAKTPVFFPPFSDTLRWAMPTLRANHRHGPRLILSRSQLYWIEYGVCGVCVSNKCFPAGDRG